MHYSTFTTIHQKSSIYINIFTLYTRESILLNFFYILFFNTNIAVLAMKIALSFKSMRATFITLEFNLNEWIFSITLIAK
jgi:hypothetical protein